jgi:DNA-binding transcriptional regulator YhcF (GntR family)
MLQSVHAIFADSPVPLYSQLADLLRQRILRGVWAPGSKVASLEALVGEGPQYLKIVGKVLYRLKDIEAYEEACLIRKIF